MRSTGIVRVNFLKMGGSAFSYKVMLYCIAGWAVFLGVLHASQYGRIYLIQRGSAKEKARIVELNKQKDKQLEMIQALNLQKLGATVKQDLVGILARRPRWSEALDYLTKNMPSQVWLSGVTIKPDIKGDYLISINGRAKSNRALTNFVMQLESSGMFSKTALIGTKASDFEKDAIEYDINTVPMLQKFQGD